MCGSGLRVCPSRFGLILTFCVFCLRENISSTLKISFLILDFLFGEGSDREFTVTHMGALKVCSPFRRTASEPLLEATKEGTVDGLAAGPGSAPVRRQLLSSVAESKVGRERAGEGQSQLRRPPMLRAQCSTGGRGRTVKEGTGAPRKQLPPATPEAQRP